MTHRTAALSLALASLLSLAAGGVSAHCDAVDDRFARYQDLRVAHPVQPLTGVTEQPARPRGRRRAPGLQHLPEVDG